MDDSLFIHREHVKTLQYPTLNAQCLECTSIMNISWPQHARHDCLSTVPLWDYLTLRVTWCRTEPHFQFVLVAETVVTFNIIAESLLMKTRIWSYKTRSNQLTVSNFHNHIYGDNFIQFFFSVTQGWRHSLAKKYVLLWAVWGPDGHCLGHFSIYMLCLFFFK
jgi:hypothetical protein